MESPNSDQTAGLKRKRSPVLGDSAEGGRAAAAAGAPPKGIGNVPQINYLVKAKAERLRLIEGDSETFGDVLGMIDDYEGMSRGRSRDLGVRKSSIMVASTTPVVFCLSLCCGFNLMLFTNFSRCTSTARKPGCQPWSQTRRSAVAEVIREVI